ncbi:FAD-dependent oxidoreductase [Microbacterium sp. UBA3394]|uniref:FAD-dependent oxidoreductase n=1 Tax=Microbacterium sp. UBA3394 TaxID=1946945 RepID=UPI000C4BB5F2|nr:FAD-dependent oxidoreductase [Microbacterium sp. UBA3394]MAB81763.1 FAD-dependent oxidoreductase [Planctomycetota bacterium]MAM53332.1 FAD-dependent oxidoreductase [Microbacterium sp.]
MSNNTTDYDVIVCGGGPSGNMAAISAGRAGAKTLVIEKYGFIGGMATSGWLGPISPMHFGDERVIDGIPAEFVDRMRLAGGSTGHLRCTNPHGSGAYLGFYDREHYKWTAIQMLQEAGVDILFHSFVSDVQLEGDTITGVEVTNKSGKRVYTSKVVVDATGDGDVAALAGAEHTVGNDEGVSQPGTLMFDMANVDTEKLKAYMDSHLDNFEWASEMVAVQPFSDRLQQKHFVGQGFLDVVGDALRTGDLYLGRDSILFLTTTHPGLVHFNSTRVAGVDGRSAESLTAGEIDARKQVMSVSEFIIKNIPGFEDAYLAGTGTQIGIRESRHILGEYVITGEDVLYGRKFDDVIARGYFPIDIHNLKGKEGYAGGGVWTDPEDSYDIPMRTLIPRRINGLVMAGRAISATHEAHGSLRTQGGAMGIGHAAGALASQSALRGEQPREVPYAAVEKVLLGQNASLRRDPEKVEREKEAAAAANEAALADGLITGLYFPGALAGTAPRL